MACIDAALLASANRDCILPNPLESAAKKCILYVFSRFSVNFYGLPYNGLLVSIPRPFFVVFLIKSLHCVTVTLLRPLSMQLPKTVPISVCTLRFSSLVSQTLQASRTFTQQESKGVTTMEVWPQTDVVLLSLLAFGARADVNNKIHQEIIFVSYF